MYGTAVGCGGYILFAGGQVGGGRSSAVDVLNGSSGEWVTNPGNLSLARSLVASACLADRYAVFAGGKFDAVCIQHWRVSAGKFYVYLHKCLFDRSNTSKR